MIASGRAFKTIVGGSAITPWRTGGFFTIALWFARLGYDPNWLKSLVEFEDRATMIYNYEGQLVPALLQTPGYARAVLMAGRPKDVEGTVAKRMARQSILDKPRPPELSILLSEGVLDVPIGGAAVMRAQLAHLLELSQRRHIAIRVVPREAGASSRRWTRRANSGRVSIASAWSRAARTILAKADRIADGGHDMTSPAWRKSTRSSEGTSEQCVEVARLSGGIGVRDSRDPDGPRLVVSRAVFKEFTSTLRK